MGHATKRFKRPNMKSVIRCALGLTVLVASGAFAGGGPLGIDSQVKFDQSGIWARKNQVLLESATLITVVGGALWEGGDSRLGKTYWQAVDSAILATAGATAGKYAFGRVRPSRTADPSQWGKSGNYSFPSGEVAFVSSAITPFVIEYGHDNPWVYALEVLPAYDSMARVKSRAHWQSDVLAGWALGTATGWYASKRDSPFMLSVMPHGVQMGLSKHW